MKRILSLIAALATLALLFVPATASQASQATKTASGNVRIGGVLWSSLGTGVVDLTPGVEAVDLLNYSYTTKNLKGYILRSGSSGIAMCKIDHMAGPTNTVHDCTNTVADTDGDGTPNSQDSDEWLSLPPRSQTLYNVEIAHDGPLFSNTGATVRLYNSVGNVVSTFQYKIS